MHPDGTIFVVQSNAPDTGRLPDSIIGLDSITGAIKFTVPLPTVYSVDHGNLIIAGDGYAYCAYAYRGPYVDRGHVNVLRVNSSGALTHINVYEWADLGSDEIALEGVYLITNSDVGVLLSWSNILIDGTREHHLANVTGGRTVTVVDGPTMPGLDSRAIVPVLQAQDGSFVGTIGEGEDSYMVAFEASGAVRWSVPKQEPAIATESGGVVTTAGIIYDQQGRAVGLIDNLPTFSWLGHAYRIGSIIDSFLYANQAAKTFSSRRGGNPSSNTTYTNKDYVPLVRCDDPTLYHRPNCPQPHDVIFNAWYLLKQRINDSTRWNVLDTFVFGDAAGGVRRSFGEYLSRGKGPEFYDGPRSTVSLKDAQCSNDTGTILGQFAYSNGPNSAGNYICELTAITCRHGKGHPLRTFWEPRVIMWRFSQGSIDDLVATAFHEALHGFWEIVSDHQLQLTLGCGIDYGDEVKMSPFLKQFVGAQAPVAPQLCTAIARPSKRNYCGTFEPIP